MPSNYIRCPRCKNKDWRQFAIYDKYQPPYKVYDDNGRLIYKSGGCLIRLCVCLKCGKHTWPQHLSRKAEREITVTDQEAEKILEKFY